MCALKAGNTIRDSARYAGVKPETAERWLRIGRGVERQRPATPEYVNFARLTEESRAMARVLVVGNLVARSRVSTRAAEVWLRVHGGDEWRDGRDQSAAAAEGIKATAHADDVLVIPPELVPEVVRELLAARRDAMPAAQHAAELRALARPRSPGRRRRASGGGGKPRPIRSA